MLCQYRRMYQSTEPGDGLDAILVSYPQNMNSQQCHMDRLGSAAVLISRMYKTGCMHTLPENLKPKLPVLYSIVHSGYTLMHV